MNHRLRHALKCQAVMQDSTEGDVCLLFSISHCFLYFCYVNFASLLYTQDCSKIKICIAYCE